MTQATTIKEGEILRDLQVILNAAIDGDNEPVRRSTAMLIDLLGRDIENQQSWRLAQRHIKKYTERKYNDGE